MRQLKKLHVGISHLTDDACQIAGLLIEFALQKVISSNWPPESQARALDVVFGISQLRSP